MTGGDSRRELGARGEDLARRHLEARGFTLLDSNFRTRHGELDLVVADTRHLVFCEVKTRIVSGPRGQPPPDELGPFAAIGPRKRRRVRLMACEWLARRDSAGPWPPELRFDAIGIAFDRRGRLLGLEHLEGAF
jgi:putative endonuclease